MTYLFKNISLSVILKNPIFLIGLTVRLILLFFVPETHSNWFTPFLNNSILGNTLDPWSSHVAASGSLLAFPYGIVMYIMLLPGMLLGLFLSSLLNTPFFVSIGLGLIVFVFDLIILMSLLDFKKDQTVKILVLYWLSPIVIIVGYWHGQLDLIPVLFLVLSLFSMFSSHPIKSAVLIACAVSAKFVMILTLPFFFIFLMQPSKKFSHFLPFTVTFFLLSTLLFLPIMILPNANLMVLGTDEVNKIYDLKLSLGENLSIYFLPATYVLLICLVLWLKRISSSLFVSFLSVSLLLVVTMTPASPGWYLWFVPFMTLTLVAGSNRLVIFAILHGIVYGLFYVINSSGSQFVFTALNWDPTNTFGFLNDAQVLSLLASLLFALNLAMSALLLREGFLRNHYFRLTRRPFIIGISGDSGSGKDTLAETVAAFLGNSKTTHLSGDNYHLWDRHKPMWKVMTHLHPLANDLTQLRSDVYALRSGKSVSGRHYDHTTGSMTKVSPINSNDFIVVSGLHALYDPKLNYVYDIKVFLDMDEQLRQFFKIQRDVHARGHSKEQVAKSIENRKSDREHFIQPQLTAADIIFKISPLHENLLKVDEKSYLLSTLKLKLRVTLKSDTPYRELVRLIVGVCGLHVDVVLRQAFGSIEITLEGDLEKEDVELVARSLSNELGELISEQPKWTGGLGGLMQLFMFNQVIYEMKQKLEI